MNLINKTKGLNKQFTVTGYVVNKRRNKMLLVNHKKLNKWLPAGGHIEPNELPHMAAIREVLEETGLQANIVPLEKIDLQLKGQIDIQIPGPYAFSYQLIPRHNDVLAHIHINMMYLLEAKEDRNPKIKRSEVHDVRWFNKEEVLTKLSVFDSVLAFAKSNLN